MSQVELAEKLGIDQSYVSRIERGRENSTIAACARYASAVGCSYSSQLVFSFRSVEINHHGIGNVTLSTCERFAHAVGAVYTSALVPLSR